MFVARWSTPLLTLQLFSVVCVAIERLLYSLLQLFECGFSFNVKLLVLLVVADNFCNAL